MDKQPAGRPSSLTSWQEFQIALKKNNADVPVLIFEMDHGRPTLRASRIDFVEFDGGSGHREIRIDGVFDKYEKYIDYNISIYVQSTPKYENKWTKFLENSLVSFVVPDEIFNILYNYIISHEISHDLIFKLRVLRPGKEDEYGIVEYSCQFETLQFRWKRRRSWNF